MAKTTKKEMYNMILNVKEISENSEMVAFINHEIELLSKKAISSKTNAKQIENDKIKNDILNILKTSDTALTISEIVKKLDSDFSNQKISALTNQLVKAESVTKEMDKKTARFKAA